MAMLLGSRGRGRGRSGLGKAVRSVWESLFGRSAWMPEPAAKARTLPLWTAGAAVMMAFAGGYFVGGQAGGPAPTPVGLRAQAPLAPGFVGEFDARPLSRQAFLVALYPDKSEADAKAAAKALSDWLVDRKVSKARPYLAKTKDGSTWSVAVYYDGDADQTATRNALVGLPDAVPDPAFNELRKTIQGWPKAYVIR